MGAMYENRTRTHPAGRRTDKDYSAKWGWGKRNSLMMEQLGVLARCGRNRLPIHKTLAGLIFHRLVHQKTDLIAHSVKKIARGLPQDEDQPYSRNALDAMAKIQEFSWEWVVKHSVTWGEGARQGEGRGKFTTLEHGVRRC